MSRVLFQCFLTVPRWRLTELSVLACIDALDEICSVKQVGQNFAKGIPGAAQQRCSLSTKWRCQNLERSSSLQAPCWPFFCCLAAELVIKNGIRDTRLVDTFCMLTYLCDCDQPLDHHMDCYAADGKVLPVASKLRFLFAQLRAVKWPRLWNVFEASSTLGGSRWKWEGPKGNTVHQLKWGVIVGIQPSGWWIGSYAFLQSRYLGDLFDW